MIFQLFPVLWCILLLVPVPGVGTCSLKPGEIIDVYNDVPVYYNGEVSNVFGRHMTRDGYNLGLKYQCVEYVKRYYLEVYDHRMPNTYGHAREFFDMSLDDGAWNSERALYQFVNGSGAPPRCGDIVVFDGKDGNPFGHTGIISNTSANRVEIVQQNVGEHSRVSFAFVKYKKRYYISNREILGWLRMSP